MREVTTPHDEMQGLRVFESVAGQIVKADAKAIMAYGLDLVYEALGERRQTGRVPVFQCGRKVGTLPADFSPQATKTTSFWYDIRPGDFRRDGDSWQACQTLGPGDFEAIPGFVAG